MIIIQQQDIHDCEMDVDLAFESYLLHCGIATLTELQTEYILRPPLKTTNNTASI